MSLEGMRAIIKRKGLSAAIFITPDPTVNYLTGIHDLSFGAVIVTPKSAEVLVSEMEYAAVKNKSRMPVVILRKKLSEHLKGKRIRKVGVCGENLAFAAVQRLKKALGASFTDISEECGVLRSIKSREEITNLSKACAITDKVFSETVRSFRNFKTESDVAAFIAQKAMQKGCALAFPTIVASGSNAGHPHHVPTKKPLQRGFCVIDMGVRYEGYCADMTRTVFIGAPGKSEKELYAKVLGAQQAGVDALLPGSRTKGVDALVRKKLGADAKRMIHSTGHGVGVEVHEQPAISAGSKQVLKEGMVVTVEPGIYFHDRGIRIEDTILVGRKPKILTKSTKKLLIIG